MRIVLTTDYFPPHLGGGVESVVFEIGRRLVQLGHEVLVLTLATQPGSLNEVMEGMEVRRFQCLQVTQRLGVQLSVSWRAGRGIGRALQEFHPDIVNAHNRFFTTTPLALHASRKLGIPTVATLHLGSLESLSGWKSATARLHEATIGRHVLGLSDAIIAVSRAVAEHVTRLAEDRTPVFIIQNGVDRQRFRPGHAMSRNGVRGIFVGRLIANKGPQFLLAALKNPLSRPPGLKLDIVGDGPMRQDLERFVARRGLQTTVNFLGLRRDVPELLQRSDFFVRPSLLEGMPLTALEAMASGLPVVMSDVGGTREVVIDGVTGYLIEPGVVSSLQRALAKITSDPSLRLRMGEAGRVQVASHFSWEIATTKTVDVFEQVRASAHV